MAEGNLSSAKLLKHSSIYVVLGFLPLGINIILAPVYTNYLSPADFGIIGLAQLFLGFISVFLGGGLQQAYGRFYFDHKRTEDDKWRLLSTTFIFVLSLALLLFPLFWFFGDGLFELAFSNDSFRFRNYGFLVFGTALVVLLHEVILSFYRNEQNIRFYSIWSLSFFAFSVTGILLGVIYFEAGAMGNIAGRTIGVLVLVFGLGLVFFTKRKWVFSMSTAREMLAYGLPLIPYALLLFGFNSLDRWMIERFFSLDQLGYYSLAFVLASSSSVFIYSLYNAVSPEVYRRLTESKDGVYDPKVRLSLEAFFVAVVLFIAVALLASPLFVSLFIDENFDIILRFLGILFVTYIFQTLYVLYTIPFFHHKKTKALPLISFISLLLGALTYYFAIQNLGFVGVFIGLAVTKFCQFICSFLFLKATPALSHPYLKLPKLWILAGLSVALSAILFGMTHYSNFQLELAYYLSGTGIIFLVLIIYGKGIQKFWIQLRNLRPNA